MIELSLVAICAFLWAIYVALKKCLTALQGISERLEVANGLAVSVVDHTEYLRVIEDATTAFHRELTRSRSNQ